MSSYATELKKNLHLKMAHSLNIQIGTYNLHGLNQGSSLLEYLCGNRDIISVQKHWLGPFNISRLDSLCPKFVCSHPLP